MFRTVFVFLFQTLQKQNTSDVLEIIEHEFWKHIFIPAHIFDHNTCKPNLNWKVTACSHTCFPSDSSHRGA